MKTYKNPVIRAAPGKKLDPELRKYVGRSFSDVLNELAPHPGSGWAWKCFAHQPHALCFIFENQAFPAIQRIMGEVDGVGVDYYRLTPVDDRGIDPGEDRYQTVFEAVAAQR